MLAVPECLKNLIGLSEQVATCESGLYVVALPGISLVNVGKTVEKKGDLGDFGDNVAAVFDECENRALLTFRNAFMASMCDCWSTSDRDVVDCLMCENKGRLASALWWYVGCEILTERMYSDRLNRYTTLDRKKASDIRDEFLERGEVELRNIVRGIDPSKSGCFESPVVYDAGIRVVAPVM